MLGTFRTKRSETWTTKDFSHLVSKVRGYCHGRGFPKCHPNFCNSLASPGSNCKNLNKSRNYRNLMYITLLFYEALVLAIGHISLTLCNALSLSQSNSNPFTYSHPSARFLSMSSSPVYPQILSTSGTGTVSLFFRLNTYRP